MKILLVNDYGTPTGGAELQMLGLRNGLRARGHDARFFASTAPVAGESSQADYLCLGSVRGSRILLQVANPSAYYRLRAVLSEFRPDVVHVRLFLTQLSPLILPLLRRVPSLYQVVWYKPVCPIGTKLLPDNTACRVRAGAVCYRNRCVPLRDWLLLMLQRQLFRRWWRSFRLILALSESVRDHLLADGIEPVEVLGIGVPVVPHRPALADPPIVAFAGRLVREKGPDVLVRAFREVVARVPGVRLVMAGAGPEAASLEQLVRDLGLADHVELPGHIPHAELERRLATAWVQAVPSRWSEPFGNVAAEAMMRGTALVASAAGRLATLVEDGRTGLLVPPGDVPALADALIRLLRERDLAERFGRAGRVLALQSLRQETFLDRIVEIYEGLVSERSA